MELLTADEVDDVLYFCRAGDVDELQQTISRIDVTARRRQGATGPTGTAQNGGHESTVREATLDLTDVMLFIRGQNQDQNTPLHYAAANGHTTTVDYLVTRARLPALLAQNSAGNTPLHWAAFNGHLEVVKRLVDEIEEQVGKSPGGEQNGTEQNGTLAASQTSSEDQRADMTEEERDAFDEREAQKRSVWDVVNKAGRGPMSEAQMNNKEAVVDYLLERIIAAPSSSAGRNGAGSAAAGEQAQSADDDELPPDAQPEGERPAAARLQDEEGDDNDDLSKSTARVQID